jgi:hypothetical protein
VKGAKSPLISAKRVRDPSGFGTFRRDLAPFIRCDRPIQLDVTQRIELELKRSASVDASRCPRQRASKVDCNHFSVGAGT